MHGRVYWGGERCRNLRRSGSQHMRSVLHSATSKSTLPAPGDQQSSIASSITTTTSVDSFFKDNRKISVGDCALFKPPQDSPPFIGLIRCLTSSKENSLHLGVNWIYRPAELKLGKGTLLDGAPNEVFYSFHKDEIPAASLLHPCKVAFLPRGVELPTGTSSFVCRRVYDIANNCLWWLTDQDYINERQEEVDQLLNKTRTEMHATLQSGDHSPKQVNGPSSTTQLKPGCDSGQNSGTSFPSQVKGKKRERGDHSADPVKRERPSRADDGDSFQGKPTTNLKSEIARITENGGMDLDGVEKLVQLMQADRLERNRDLLNRSMLAGVMAATDKDDCLNRFVQLRGLHVLNEWLQDVHKGKIGDGNSLKDGDKSVEEFLLVLLRALDKLPVNLQALQMCNIGRSVNHLRSHKNFDIQKKARSLVDKWKKSVEAEMISIDTKSGSTQAISVWPSKSRLPEASHSGSRTPSGSEIAMKSSVTQCSASKTTSARSSHGESIIKSATSSPGPLKLASSPASGKESQPRVSVGGTPDVPVLREDRKNNSVQSNNFCQSGKEEAGSLSLGIMNVHNIISSGIRNRKISGFPGVSVTGAQKETSSSRGSSAHKNTVLDKSQSASTCERVLEVPIAEGNSHRLIVKIPNRIRSPAHGVSGESLEDPMFMSSRVSSPILSDKHEQLDCNAKDKNDAYRFNVSSDMNLGSWEKIDSKGLSTVSGEGDGSPAAVPDVGQSMTTEDSRRLIDRPPVDQFKSSKLHASTFSSMNALIESCVKYSEAKSSLSLEDDVGMNLLASVATGEISRSDLISPTDSIERSSPADEENCIVDEAKFKPSPENYIAPGQSQFYTDAECGDKKQSVLGCNSFSVDKLPLSDKLSLKFNGDKQCGPSHTSEDMPAGEGNEHFVSSSRDLRSSMDFKCETTEKSYEKSDMTSLTLPISTEKLSYSQSSEEIQEEKAPLSNVSANGTLNCKTEEINGMMTEGNAGIVVDEGKPTVETAGSNHLCEVDGKKDSKERLHTGINLPQKVATPIKSEFAERENSEKLHKSACGQYAVSDNDDEVNLGRPDENDSKNFMNESERLNVNKEVGMNADNESHSIAGLCSSHNDLKSNKEANVENKKITEQISLGESKCIGSVNHELQQTTDFEGPKCSSIQPDDAKKCAPTVAEASSSATGETDLDAKIKFDLNEGFSADDGKFVEPVTLIISPCSTTSNMINNSSFSVNSVPIGHSASITVAAAAKGPFVPPEDLMRSKGEFGWKGSAATSAFRPAEPRKFLETSFGLTNMPCSDASASKQGRIPLDIDLNVPDERVLERMASQDSPVAVDSTTDFVSNHATLLNEAPGRGSGGLDLDLNRVVEANDNANCSTSSYFKGEGSIAHIRPLGGLPHGDIRRDFDLNDGPVVDNASAEQFSISKQVKGGIPSPLTSAGLRMNNPGLGSFSSWFPPGNTYSTVSIPSVLPDRGDPPFPVFAPGAPQRTFGPIGVTPITPDVYRGSVLSSSPAVPFPSGPFQFPVFPFRTTFPLSSATFPVGVNSYADSSSGTRLFAPPVNSQFLGPVGSVTSQFQRPYVVNLPDSSSIGGLENNRKWGRQCLDLNTGPGAPESEAREESFAQHSVVSSQPVVEEQARMYSVSGGILKRKEPDGGRDNENFRYKQFSWQ